MRRRRYGVYLKRILVAQKERGTGSSALRTFLDRTFARRDVPFVWLIVLEGNARAQAVYRDLGFERFDPPPEEEPRFQRVDTSLAGAFRMRIDRPQDGLPSLRSS